MPPVSHSGGGPATTGCGGPDGRMDEEVRMAESSGRDALGNLATAAHERHVVVVGAGIAGLVAALECAKFGLRVTLVEAHDRLGGTLAPIDVAGLRLDAAAEGWSTR